MKKRILLAPSLEKGMGTGHLMRCRFLADRLRAETRILIRDSDSPAMRNLIREGRVLNRDLGGDEPWDFILLDRRSTSKEQAADLAAHGCIIGLDEGGPARRFLPYLVDALPGASEAHGPNVTVLPYEEKGTPAHRREASASGRPFERLLLSFGGEDPAHLSEALLGVLQRVNRLGASSVTVVEGPVFGKRDWRLPEGDWLVLRNVSNLRMILPRFDLVFTSFGLTCMEALYAGVPVILFNPSRYHRRLSRGAGLPEIGVRRPSLTRLRRLWRHPQRLFSAMEKFRSDFLVGRPTLERQLDGLEKPKVFCCPVCAGAFNPVVARFPDRSYLRCSSCRLLYQLDFTGHRARYDSAYFDEEYARQYGRSYLEDFERIKLNGRGRLKILRALSGRSPGKRLLDVGCAYGPFLQAAVEQGFSASGIDVIPEAVSHVAERLRIPCRCVPFMEHRQKAVDVLSMWYVIEHFADVHAVLGRAADLLSPGGIFCFSTPNGRGISARRSLRRFLERSPRDHSTVWSAGAARRILRRYGLRVVRIRVTGHHPERFPGCGSLRRGGVAWRAIELASRLFALGDTFEVYARKS